VIEGKEKLLVQTPESIRDRFHVDIRVNSEVVKIDRAGKTVEVYDRKREMTYSESYDKLILSPGAEPVRPKLPGIDHPNVFTIRNIPVESWEGPGSGSHRRRATRQAVSGRSPASPRRPPLWSSARGHARCGRAGSRKGRQGKAQHEEEPRRKRRGDCKGNESAGRHRLLHSRRSLDRVARGVNRASVYLRSYGR
jgi:hypothetical protein